MEPARRLEFWMVHGKQAERLANEIKELNGQSAAGIS
jgi:hypothetical protein